jgi:hypothetical protein
MNFGNRAAALAGRWIHELSLAMYPWRCRLAELKAEGTLSETEYDKAKAKILA